ncbi:MAG: DUF1761 domain-containing protein [Betaproteobacteria bacterium]
MHASSALARIASSPPTAPVDRAWRVRFAWSRVSRIVHTFGRVRMVVTVNPLAIIAAALSTFVLGGLWYSRRLFGRAWGRANGATQPSGEGHPVRAFGLSFAFALVAAFAYAVIVPAPENASQAAVQGVMVGAGIVAASFGIHCQFANRSTALWLIVGGTHAAQFLLYGLILGLWR